MQSQRSTALQQTTNTNFNHHTHNNNNNHHIPHYTPPLQGHYQQQQLQHNQHQSDWSGGYNGGGSTSGLYSSSSSSSSSSSGFMAIDPEYTSHTDISGQQQFHNSRFHPPITTEIECSVQNVYPLPELTIYQVMKDGLQPRTLENAQIHQNATRLSNGAFSVSVTAVIEDAELLLHQQLEQQRQQQQRQRTMVIGNDVIRSQQQKQLSTLSTSLDSSFSPTATTTTTPSPTIFECLVSQDEIRHELRKRTLYTPATIGNTYPQHMHMI